MVLRHQVLPNRESQQTSRVDGINSPRLGATIVRLALNVAVRQIKEDRRDRPNPKLLELAFSALEQGIAPVAGTR